MGVLARQFRALGGTTCFRRPDGIPLGLAPNHDVISGRLADSEVGTLWPVRLSCVVAAGPSGSGKKGNSLRGGDRRVCSEIFLS